MIRRRSAHRFQGTASQIKATASRGKTPRANGGSLGKTNQSWIYRVTEQRERSDRHISAADRHSIDKALHHPTAHNLSWMDVLHVLKLVGTAEQGPDGKCSLQVNGKHLVFQLESDIAIQAPTEHQLAGLLAAELDQPGPHSSLYAESIALALTIQLVRNHGTDQVKLVSIRGGLAPWQLRRVFDYLEENLANDVSSSELAAIVDLSTAHFSRQFKTSTGLPPHRYQLALRIERAKNLLLQSKLSLKEIALSCGFFDQGHLSKSFRRLVGLSPAAWQRSCRTR
jgi:AraC-like DNA-binding protein